MPVLTPGLIYGWLDVELAEGFENELQKIKAALPDDLDVVYSSPSSRCTKLAQEIASEYQTDVRLREMHFGNWEGKTWDTIDQNDLKIWGDNYIHFRVPGGENMLDLEERVRAFYNECIKGNSPKTGIVTHAGVIRMLITIAQNRNLSEFFSIGVKYGEVIKIEISG